MKQITQFFLEGESLNLKKTMELEEDKTDEYYAFKTSEDSEDDNIFYVVAGHAVSAVVSKMTSKPRKRRGKNKVRHIELWEQGFICKNEKEHSLSNFNGLEIYYFYLLFN